MAKFKRSLARFAKKFSHKVKSHGPNILSRRHAAATSPTIRMVGNKVGRVATTTLGAAGVVAAGSTLLHLASPSRREAAIKASGIANKLINANTKHKALLTFGAVAKHALRKGGETRGAMGLAAVAGLAAHTPARKYLTDPILLATRNAAQGVASGAIKQSGLHEYTTVTAADAIKGNIMGRIHRKRNERVNK